MMELMAKKLADDAILYEISVKKKIKNGCRRGYIFSKRKGLRLHTIIYKRVAKDALREIRWLEKIL